MRIAQRRRRIQADLLQQDGHQRLALRLGQFRAQGLHPLLQDLAHPHARIERGERILEHDLHLGPFASERLALQLADRRVAQAHAACSRLDQAQDGARQRGLATAGLANQGQGLARRDLERHPVDCLDPAGHPAQQTLALRKVHRQILHAQQRRGLGLDCLAAGCRGRCGSGRPGLDHEVTAGEMPRGPLMKTRRLLPAARPALIAAVGEAAAGEGRAQRRHRARDMVQAFAAPLGRGQHAEQLLRIGMHRAGKQSLARRPLDDLAGVHDGHAIGHVAGDVEVVGDQQQAHAALGLQSLEQAQDLGLDRDIQRGGRLVGDQNPGLARQHGGDQRPLALAPRELEGVTGRQIR